MKDEAELLLSKFDFDKMKITGLAKNSIILASLANRCGMRRAGNCRPQAKCHSPTCDCDLKRSKTRYARTRQIVKTQTKGQVSGKGSSLVKPSSLRQTGKTPHSHAPRHVAAKRPAGKTQTRLETQETDPLALSRTLFPKPPNAGSQVPNPDQSPRPKLVYPNKLY